MKKRVISLLLAIILLFSLAVSAGAYQKSDLQTLYDNVAIYIYNSEKILESTLTESEDTMCATAILIAKKALLSDLFSEEEYDVIYRELYNAYGFMTLVSQRNNTMTNPKVVKLLKAVISLVANNDYYKTVDEQTATNVKNIMDKSLEYINNPDKYAQDDINAQMNQLFITLQEVAKYRCERFNTKYGARILEDVTMENWYYEAVHYVYGKGLFKGTSKTTFSPDVKMTRGMFVTVLSRFAGANTEVKNTFFVDVDPQQYYAGPVAWAYEGGIISWVDSNTFNPNEPITREEMVTTMYNYCKYIAFDFSEIVPTDESGLSDIGKAASFSKEALRYAHAMKVINGYEDGSLRPKGTATRAEVAQVFINLEYALQ